MDQSSPIHYRHSIRLKEYDYSTPGAYFVTVVANGFNCIFGKVNNEDVTLYDLGKLAYECWREIPNHFPSIDIEPFIIMPNHIHGVLTIHENERRGTISSMR